MRLQCTAQREGKLLSFLRRELALSSSLVKRLKFRGAYTVNGERVFTDYPVRVGDRIEVCMDENAPENYAPEAGELRILLEDEWLIALDKPPGVLMHPSSARNTGTLANFLLDYYQKTGQASAVHPVSRLDRDTFGVVLLAKSSHVHARFHAMQRAGTIEKTYHAAVLGVPPEASGEIDAPIARVPGSSLLRCVDPSGKPARSAYRVLETRPVRGTVCSLLELHPLTGRTHQLRLHCAYLGCPILGDPQYATAASRALSDALGLTGQQLCAVSLRFAHPMTGKIVEILSNQALGLDFPPRQGV